MKKLLILLIIVLASLALVAQDTIPYEVLTVKEVSISEPVNIIGVMGYVYNKSTYPDIRTDVFYSRLNRRGVGTYAKMGTGKQDASVSYIGNNRYITVSSGYAQSIGNNQPVAIWLGAGLQWHRTKYDGTTEMIMSPLLSTGFAWMTKFGVALIVGVDMAIMQTVDYKYYQDKHSNFDTSFGVGIGYSF